jgi:hypothetical protein
MIVDIELDGTNVIEVVVVVGGNFIYLRTTS